MSLYFVLRSSRISVPRLGANNSAATAPAAAVQDKMTEGVEAASSKVKDMADKTKDAADKASAKARATKSSDTSAIDVDDMEITSGR